MPRMELRACAQPTGPPHSPALEVWPQGTESMAPLAIVLGCGMSVLPTRALELHLSGSSTKWLCRVRMWPLSSATVSEHTCAANAPCTPSSLSSVFPSLPEKTGKILNEFLHFYEEQYGVALFHSMRHEIEATGPPQSQLLWRKVRSATASPCLRRQTMGCMYNASL